MAEKNDNAEVDNAVEERHRGRPRGLTPTAEQAEAAAEVVEAAAEADEPVEAVVPALRRSADEAAEEAEEAEEAAEERPSRRGVCGGGEAPRPAAAAARPRAKRKKKRLPRALPAAAEAEARAPRPASRSSVWRSPSTNAAAARSARAPVVSDAMDKTIVVRVDTISAHRKYKKVVRRSRKFHAHDERNEAKVGDVVRIVETRRSRR